MLAIKKQKREQIWAWLKEMTAEVHLTFVFILSVYCHSEKKWCNVKDLKDWMLSALRLSSKAGRMYVCLMFKSLNLLLFNINIRSIDVSDVHYHRHKLFYLGTSHKKLSSVTALKRSQPVWIRTGKVLCSTVTLHRKQVLETLPWSRRITLLNGEGHYGGKKSCRGLV